MAITTKLHLKCRIKSFCYDDLGGGRRLLFTIEEEGVTGERRQFAEEIVADANWTNKFSITDASVILYALADDERKSTPDKRRLPNL